MSTEVIPGPMGEVRAASTAGGGTALTGTAARIFLPLGTKHLDLVGRNYSTAVVIQWLPCPWLTIFKTADSLATSPTDYSYEAQDNSTSTSVTLSGLGTAAQGDFLYVGSRVPFSGVAIDIDAANGNASVITVKYRKSDNTWADISATDGTDNAGASLGVDGSVTWTVPADWLTARLRETGDTGVNFGVAQQEMFWTRWQWSAALDASTTLDSMVAIPRSTVYHEIPSGTAWEQAVTVGPGEHGISAIQAKTDAGTANLIIDCAARGRFA